MKKLYFVENIHTISLSNEEKDVKYIITLEDVERSEEIAQRELDQERFGNEPRNGEESIFITRTYSSLPRLKDSHYSLHEGQYVYRNTETGDFEAAYNDSIAKARFNKNLRLRNKLISFLNINEREEGVDDTQALFEDAHVESYHVNVGHAKKSKRKAIKLSITEKLRYKYRVRNKEYAIRQWHLYYKSRFPLFLLYVYETIIAGFDWVLFKIKKIC